MGCPAKCSGDSSDRGTTESDDFSDGLLEIAWHSLPGIEGHGDRVVDIARDTSWFASILGVTWHL